MMLKRMQTARRPFCRPFTSGKVVMVAGGGGGGGDGDGFLSAVLELLLLGLSL